LGGALNEKAIVGNIAVYERIPFVFFGGAIGIAIDLLAG